MRPCEAEGCDRPYLAKGMCNMHYKRAHAKPKKSRPTREERFWAKVEKTDGCWNWTGMTSGDGYAMFYISNERGKTMAYRYSYELHVEPIKDGMVIDHICHNPLCVRPDHLRQVTHKQNLENLAGLKANNKSGYQGVSWHRRAKKWYANINDRGHIIWLGSFDDVHEAGRVAREARLLLQTHNDHDRRAA